MYVLEVNPRASHAVPIFSKITGIPMVSLATRIMIGESLKLWAILRDLFLNHHDNRQRSCFLLFKAD